MKVIISISENGNIICKKLSSDRYKYENLYNCLYIIEDILNGCKEINITSKNNKTINYNNGQDEVIIKSFNNNKSMELANIINTATSIFLKYKRNKLKKRKVSRRRALVAAVVISIGVSSATLLNNDKNLAESIDEDIDKPEYTYQVEEDYQDKSYLDDIVTLNNEENFDLKENYDLEYESRTNDEKFLNAKENYYSIISRIASDYGLDPNIMLAIATQESGVHSSEIDGPAMGLMQIELSAWNNSDITAYNYKTNSYETLHITEDKLADLEFNIRVSCMIFQNCLKNSHYNLEVAIQMYNYGYGNILKAFRMYYGDNITLDEALDNYDDGWLQCREYISAGDKDYLEHVMSYVEDNNDINFLDNDNNTVSYSFSNKKTL